MRRLLDHDSAEITARYATLKDETLRGEWERFRERINIRGELLPLDPDGPRSDAAWAKENLARAKQTRSHSTRAMVASGGVGLRQ